MKILITGGTGLIGTLLSEKLINSGHSVRILSRSKQNIPNIEVFEWNTSKNYIEKGALEGIDAIVHLAGAGIADKRWTDARKREIIDSRVESLKCIIANLPKNHNIKTVVGGSAIGYYGGNTGENLMDENSAAGKDFLAKCTVLWEKEEEKLAEVLEARLVKIRTGVVFSTRDGAFPKLIAPVKLNLGAALGSGKQWISWIHEDDLVAMFEKAITNNNIEGVYNGVAPEPVRNDILNQMSAKILNKAYFLPKVPGFVLKLALGEMSVVVLGSSKVENKRKILDRFKYPTLPMALENLLK